MWHRSVHINFKNPDDTIAQVKAHTGMSILEVAHQNEIELEGACESSMACSTCHVILEDDVYESLEPACEDEEDMLDMAFGLTDTSRLGCQVIVNKEMEGTTVSHLLSEILV
uniref:2Fe-2S ferredoxin n=1 Tax=Albugo laibachii Nc14 TaxID=890382 RepID=F0WFE6_9STRA|nr:Ferredoxin putative [Albugo laibachii Nc14]|eukprot:CCA19928.1 Ferredoxin putative [Albugo laibachii Nc14]